MLYHSKLLDHFTGKVILNLPFFLHKNLTKICKKIKATPFNIKNALYHYGLIKIIIMEELKRETKLGNTSFSGKVLRLHLNLEMKRRKRERNNLLLRAVQEKEELSLLYQQKRQVLVQKPRELRGSLILKQLQPNQQLIRQTS